ncbi:hypothetical protein K438DRAFT_1785668 [Mycena galopus ATCC 62051]|nr:hypothetical protein K438DRAFT_1785668 [Mycena galopus ATCC 62051]
MLHTAFVHEAPSKVYAIFGEKCFYMEIANGENRQTFTLPVIIGSPILSLVKEGAPWKMVYPENGEVIETLMTIHSSMEFLNEHIRADMNNQLLLRTEMRPSDIKLIRDVRAGSDSPPVKSLRAKMAREEIYRGLLVLTEDPVAQMMRGFGVV